MTTPSQITFCNSYLNAKSDVHDIQNFSIETGDHARSDMSQELLMEKKKPRKLIDTKNKQRQPVDSHLQEYNFQLDPKMLELKNSRPIIRKIKSKRTMTSFDMLTETISIGKYTHEYVVAKYIKRNLSKKRKSRQRTKDALHEVPKCRKNRKLSKKT